MEMLMITAARMQPGHEHPTHVCVGRADSASTTWRQEPEVQPIEQVIDAIGHGERAMVRKPAVNGFTLGPEVVRQALDDGRVTLGFKPSDTTLRSWSDLPAC